MTAFELQSLSCGYRRRPVLHELSLRIEQGECVALIGPNGVGKSTLLKALTGRIRPESGQISLFGEALATLPDWKRGRLLGVVPQQLPEQVPFTVAEMFQVAAKTRGAGEAEIAAAAALTRTADFLSRPFTALSGGERQRVALAMAVVGSPKAVLLDEPAAHLDLRHRLEMLQLVRRLNAEAGATIIMAIHELDEAAAFFDRIILLTEGRIAADGSSREVYTPERLSRVYGCPVEVMWNEKGVPHVEAVLDGNGLSAIDGCGSSAV